METKKCTCCGQEKPIDKFKKIGGRSGNISTLTVCHECMQKKQVEGRAKAKAQREAEQTRKEQENRQLRLQDFSPRELMKELYRRGYIGNLQFTQTIDIDISKLD